MTLLPATVFAFALLLTVRDGPPALKASLPNERFDCSIEGDKAHSYLERLVSHIKSSWYSVSFFLSPTGCSFLLNRSNFFCIFQMGVDRDCHSQHCVSIDRSRLITVKSPTIFFSTLCVTTTMKGDNHDAKGRVSG